MATEAAGDRRPLPPGGCWLLAAAIAILAAGCGAGDDATDGAAARPVAPDAAAPPARPLPRPNILLIVADDLGYSDLGIYGSGIDTPNLDSLAQDGVRFTQFYASPMCSTTRAMLLTGVDNHRAGLGNLAERLADNQKGQPGYEGHLNDRVVTVAELLRAAGYRTYMSGKWHLGEAPPANPAKHGFDRSFALLESGAGHFANMLPLLGPGKALYTEDGQPVESLPADFYSSSAYVQKLIDYLQQDAGSSQPFFAYLAFTAPHFPLQAPRATIDKYRGRFDRGYEALQAERLQGLQRAGLLSEHVRAFPLLPSQRHWSELDADERRWQSRLMEVYAAMIDELDQAVGRLIAYLSEQGRLDDTVIVFLSDNGAEGHYLEWGLNVFVPWSKACCDNSLDNLGSADSYLMLGPNWARAAAAPFRMFKGFTSEGGVRVPAFVRFPARVPGGRVNGSLADVLDLVPTVLDFAGVEAPAGRFQGRDVLPLQGASLLPVLLGRAGTAHGPDYFIGWEAFGKRGIRQGDWKILWETSDAHWWDAAALGIRRDAWQLYNLAEDPAELTDRSSAEPGRLDALKALWERYVRDNGVVLPDHQRGY